MPLNRLKKFKNIFETERVIRYTGFLIRWKYLILSAALILACAGLYFVRNLSIDSSIMALLPENTPSVERVCELEKKTGGFGDLIIMLESSSYPNGNIAFAEKILPEIQRLPWVENASYKTDNSFFNKNKLLYMHVNDLQEVKNRVKSYIEKKQQKYNPFLVDLLEREDKELDFSDIEKKYSSGMVTRWINQSDDGKILLIVIHPGGSTSNIAFAKSIFKDVNNIIDSFKSESETTGVSVSIGGTYRNRLDEYYSILNNVKSSLLAGAVIILLLLLLYFRRVSHVICLLIPLFLSIICTFALTAITLKSLNLITAFLIIVLFGLGIDFGIHMLSRYRGYIKNGLDHYNALVGTISHSGKSCLSAALTTVAAFAMLTFSDFLGFRHFGFIAGTGVFLAFISYIVLLPVLLTILNDQSKQSITVKQINQNNNLSGSLCWNNYYKTAVIICAVISGFMLLESFKIRFENDFRNLRAHVPTTREFNAKVNKIFREARDPAAILVKDASEARAVTDYLKRNNLSSQNSPVESVKSILSVVPDSQDAKLSIIRDIKLLVSQCRPYLDSAKFAQFETQLVDSPIALTDIPPGISRFFQGQPTPQGQLMYLYQRKSLLDLNNAREFADAVGLIKTGGKVYHAISEPLVYIDLINLVERDSLIAIVGAFVLIFALVFLNTNGMRSALLVMSTLIVGSLWMIGCMALFDIKINLFNLVIFPSILGLAVDSSIHIFGRLENEEKLNSTAFFETSGATIMSTLTTLVGFGSFFFGKDPHPGLQSLAITAIIGMSTNLLASLTYLPPMVFVTRRKN